jgi:hypothetical protein
VNAFRQSLNIALNSTQINNTSQGDEIKDAVGGFEESMGRLRDRSREQRLASTDVRETLIRANRIDSFMRSTKLTTRAQNDWRYLRSDLDQLARSYHVNWRWDRASNPPQRSAGLLRGTWRLDTSRSDNVDDSINRATRNTPSNERQIPGEQIRRRLDAPETIAIEQQGRRFTIASTRAPQATFDADGRVRTEYSSRGRAIQVKTSIFGDQLVVSSTGERGNDYHVTFDPIDNGQRMRVTRRIYSEQFSQPALVTSVYEKTSDFPQLNLYTGSWDNDRRVRRDRNRFFVPNNTILTAVLGNNLNTKEVNAGDRFTMIVRSPSQYNGAVIEGVITEVQRSGRITGRSQMSLDFERIRLRNGGVYDFAGNIESIRTPGGDDIRIDNEGTVREESQTERTVTRSGIGAAIGAVIGAIAGGGKGAAIGAAIGAGTGAGSVLVQGRDDLNLRSGTELTVRASSPN